MKVAIMYDFDKTLCTKDMQEYNFIPSVGLSANDFWGKCDKLSKEEHMDKILSYLYLMIKESKKNDMPIKRDTFNNAGKNIEFYPGVTTWFKRINDYAESKGIKVEHYLVSSGTMEIVEGCPIFPCFTKAWGCEYYYNKDGEPVWPKLAINYTQKTQFYFRISKGAVDVKNDNAVNEKTPERRIPYKNIIYMGDGMTDVACMTLVKHNDGTSIAIYPEKDSDKVRDLYTDGRCNFMCKADYSAGSDLEKVVKLTIDKIAMQYEIIKREKLLANK